MVNLRRAGIAAAAAAAPMALAYRFAIAYRSRAGYPRRSPPRITPAELGLPYENLVVPTDGGALLPAWFIPAADGRPGPGVALIHGWESARDRTLPMVQFLNAAGFHCLTIDVRGHGANPPEALPVSAGEFGADALAAFRALLERPDVTVGAISGHSMGGIGGLLAAAADDRVAAVVSSSAPADPYRLTRLTFRLARLPIPNPIAYPLAWLTTRVYLRPRGHGVRSVSAAEAVRRYAGPLLLAHGDADDVVPIAHLRRLADAARAGRAIPRDDGGLTLTTHQAPVEVEVVPGGQHSWLYEFPGYRRAVARFLATAMGGPYPPEEAGDRAAAFAAERLPDNDPAFETVEAGPGGLRTLAQLVRPHQPASDPGNGAGGADNDAGSAGPAGALGTAEPDPDEVPA